MIRCPAIGLNTVSHSSHPGTCATREVARFNRMSRLNKISGIFLFAESITSLNSPPTMFMNVFSLRTRPCSWPLTWLLRAPVPPKCVVLPSLSNVPYSVTDFGSIMKTTHMQSQYWVQGSPPQAMMTMQHQNVTCGA